MKTLMRMKLINWHRFYEETLNFGASVLISGENGAGKSTLLDAIQFVIMASKNNFNKAAHENGKRKLTGYVRCKTGRENKPYERSGHVTSHIALEFYEESRDKYFVIGAVVDSASEDSEKAIWYRMEDVQLEDSFFKTGNRPKNIEEFRSTNKKYLKMTESIQANARKDFKGRFGRLEDKFFELIPKSLAFKPIDDIKDFVYSYVLDKKEVNIEVLRENVRTYQEFEGLLKTIRVKLEKLEKIREHYRQVQECRKKDQFYDYYIARAEQGINEQNIRAQKKHMERCNLRAEELKREETRVKAERDNKQELAENLIIELAANEDFLAIRKVEERIESLKNTISDLEEKKKRLMISVKRAVKENSRLAGRLEAIRAEESGNAEAAGRDCQVLKDFEQVFSNIEGCEDITEAGALVEDVKLFKQEMSEEIGQKLFSAEREREHKEAELKELNRKIEGLSNKKLDYGPFISKLQIAIKQELVRLGRAGEVRVLCELLSITDEKWKNAVEGYLNTQKFYLLVSPEDFDVALYVYEKMKETHGMYGAGVINALNLEKYDKAVQGSLAEKVTSKSLYAKRFVNMLLNDVMMCQRAEELKQYRKAITASCMKYQNRVAVVLNPKTYEIPFIGENAYKVQLERAKEAQAEKQREINLLNDKIKGLREIKALLGYDDETTIIYEVSAILELKSSKVLLERSLKEKASIEQNSTIMLKQMEIDRLKESIKALETTLGQNHKWQGDNLNQIQVAISRLEELSKRSELMADNVSKIEISLKAEAAICRSEYQRRSEHKDLNTLRNSYEQTKKGNLTKQSKAEAEMIARMGDYKSEHDFGAEASLQGYYAFEDVYEKLKNSELLDYEERVQKARMAAEEEFREQFLSKLQENIRNAKAEFTNLNNALKNIPFGVDFYKFEYSGSKKYKMYYDMIMDDFNVGEGASLFSGSFNERHKEVIEELFERLTCEEGSSGKALEEFTDYRTYMDYDIRINHGEEGFSYYSKVCEEKSGGETQTPFYVTVAASFVQLYSGGIGGDSIGLILLDEAFNNMDDERISGVLEFFTKLPLQIIVAAPPDKIQYIQPTLKHTMLVLKDGEQSYVEGYAHEAL